MLKGLAVKDVNVLKSIPFPCYLAPEILLGQSFTNKSDVWSLGLLFY